MHTYEETIHKFLEAAFNYQAPELSEKAQAVITQFGKYSDYNKRLMQVQTGTDGIFVTTQSNWENKFHRTLNIDAQPMAILSRTPIIYVYDYSDTYGESLPYEEELADYLYPTKCSGFDDECYKAFVENVLSFAIGYMEKKFAYNYGGRSKLRGQRNAGSQCAVSRIKGGKKYDVLVNANLDSGSKTWVLTHELAHILLGHVDTVYDKRPFDEEPDIDVFEVEAETACAIVRKIFGYPMEYSIKYLSHYRDAILKYQKNIRYDLLISAAEQIYKLMPK